MQIPRHQCPKESSTILLTPILIPSGNPPPAVFWNKAASQNLMFPRQDHGRFSVTDAGTLIIEPVRKEDEGEYVCQALSVAGSAFAMARMQVSRGTRSHNWVMMVYRHSYAPLWPKG